MRQLSRHGGQLATFLPVEPGQVPLLGTPVPPWAGVETWQPVLVPTHNLASPSYLQRQSPWSQQKLLELLEYPWLLE